MIGIFILLAFILVGVSMSFNMPKKVEETPPTPNVKTQYRITSNGYWDFLEYKEIGSIAFREKYKEYKLYEKSY